VLLFSCTSFSAAKVAESAPTNSHTQKSFKLTASHLMIGNLSAHVVYLSDDRAKTIAEARALEFNAWTALDGEEFNVGYQKGGYWLRANVSIPIITRTSSIQQNDSIDTHGPWVLVIHNDYQDLKVYREDDTVLNKLYDARGNTVAEKDQDGRHRTVPIDLSLGGQFRLYLYVRSMGATQYPLSLLPLEKYFLFETNLLSGTYLAIGSLVVMMVLSLAFGWIFRDISLIYYGLSIFLVAAVNVSVQELPEQWFGPLSHGLFQHAIFTCLALGQVAFTLFTRQQMISSGNHPFYPKFFKILAWAAVLVPLACAWLLPLHLQRQVMLMQLALSAIFWLVAGIHNSLRKQRAAMVYLLGVTIYLFTAFSQVLNKIGIFPGALLTDNIQAFGLVISLTLLLLSVSSRFSAYTRLTLAAQKTALSYEQSARESQSLLLDLERKTTESLERKVAERTLELESAIKLAEQAKFEAEEADFQKARFLAAASHDIRQPLQALSLLAETLLHDCRNQTNLIQVRQTKDPNADEKKAARGVFNTGFNIRSAVENLIQLIDMLFDLSKLDNKLVKPTFAPIELEHCVDEFARTVRPLCQQNGVELVVDLDDEAMFINSDIVLLQRILHILVDNALKHAQCSQVRLKVTVQHKQALLVVADNGIGIPISEQANVFEEFYQLKNPERNAREGMGMGLALCKRLIDLLGYRLKLKSSPGKGTCFELQMACSRGQGGVNRQVEQGADPYAFVRFSGEKIVVVDDDVMACHALVRLVERWGLECRYAYDAAGAIEIVKNGWDPVLAILDYRLPDAVDGFSLSSQLRKHLGKHLGILIFTGDTELVSPSASLPVLYKPLRPIVLRAAITNQLLSADL
jgi:signal transduction histidine kinase/CheY-like chemotaxis protein